jgi:hypothetical protein
MYGMDLKKTWSESPEIPESGKWIPGFSPGALPIPPYLN